MDATVKFDASVSEGNVDALQFKVASSRAELAGAFRLVHASYLRSGLECSNASGMRITLYHLLPTTTVFVGMLGDEVVTTLTLVIDGDGGLPMEAMYGDEIAQWRGQDLRMAEVTCLADRRREFRRFLPSFCRLSRLMAQFARRQGVDQLLAAVHPKHARFYKRFLGFENAGGLRECPYVQNRPASAVCLNFADAQRNENPCYDRYFGEPINDEQLQPFQLSPADRDFFERQTDRGFKAAS